MNFYQALMSCTDSFNVAVTMWALGALSVVGVAGSLALFIQLLRDVVRQEVRRHD